MKNLRLSLTLVLSSLVLLTGCQPEDKKITDPRMSLFNKREGGGFNNGGRKGEGLRIGAFAGAASLYEKEVEAVEIVKAVLASEAGLTRYSLTGGEKTAQGVKLSLQADSNDFKYTTSQGDFKNKVRVKLEGELFEVPSEGVSEGTAIVAIKGAKLFQSVDKLGGGKTYINLNTDSYDLQLKVGKTTREYILTLSAQGRLDSSLNGVRGKSENFTYDLTMTLDRDSLMSSDTVKVLSSNNVFKFKRSPRDWELNVFGSDHEIKLGKRCHSLNGTVELKSDRPGKPNRSVTARDSELTVSGSNYKSDAAPCGERPTFDLSRLFIY